MTFTPGLIVRIDWDDAGDYSHADSDVTADHAAHEVQWGADAESDRGGLFSAYAEGTLVLRNLGGRYTLGTSSAQPGIGGRHRCQLQATYGLYGGSGTPSHPLGWLRIVANPQGTGAHGGRGVPPRRTPGGAEASTVPL